MRQLLAPAPSSGSSSPEADLDAVYAYPPHPPEPAGAPTRLWLRASMVTSADGAAAAAGRSAGLSGPADRRVLGVLRALADVVLVGAGTARAEGYGPVRARPSYAERRAAAGQRPAAALAVVTASLDLDLDGPLFVGAEAAAATAPTLVLTCAVAPAARRAALEQRGATVVVAGGDRVDLPAALAALQARGLRRVLCEGGPQLLAQLVAADLLDELDLTISPLLTGGPAPRVINGPLLDLPARLHLVSLLEDDGFLFARYVRAH